MKNESQKIISLADIILLAGFIIVGGVSILLLLGRSKQGLFAKVIVDGKTVVSLNLNEEREYTLDTPEGTNTIIVQDGQVFVSYADCPDKVCKNHKPIKNNGETIICLPHKMVIEIAE